MKMIRMTTPPDGPTTPDEAWLLRSYRVLPPQEKQQIVRLVTRQAADALRDLATARPVLRVIEGRAEE